MLPDFLFCSLFPVQQTTSGIGHRVCVCVFFPSILDIKFVGRTSRGHTGFLIHLPSAVRALIFVARRIQPFLSLVDREVEFCKVVFFGLATNTLNVRNNKEVFKEKLDHT